MANAGGSIPERLFPKRTPSIQRRRTFPTRSPTRNLSKSERVLLRMDRFRPRAAHRNEPHQCTKQSHTASSSTHGHGERREAAGQVPGVRRFHSRARGKTSGAYPVFATVSVSPTGAGKDGKRDSIRRKVFEEKRGGVWGGGRGTFLQKGSPSPSPMFFRRIYVETTPVRGLP